MSTDSSAQPGRHLRSIPDARDSNDLLRASRSGELILGVVGHLGSGTSEIASRLADALRSRSFSVHRIRATDVIATWAAEAGRSPAPRGRKTPEWVDEYQQHGDAFRETRKDEAVVAVGVIGEITAARARDQGVSYTIGAPVVPDGARRAFVVDALRHPAEVKLLRQLYRDAFALIGVVCEEGVREQRLLENLFNASEHRLPESRTRVQQLMKRDADDTTRPHGQHVRDAFELADYFIDNTPDNEPPQGWNIPEVLGRLVDLIGPADRIVRPTVAETAMHHAWSARLKSSCLSRQVGAALTDQHGEIISTGTNEVPRFGGGSYAETSMVEANDGRCWTRNGYCSNTKEQLTIARKLVESFPELTHSRSPQDAERMLMRSPVGSLIEFSRAVHAEMAAVLGAARSGRSPVGGTLYSTTFPCHGCARNLVAAGVVEVQYIEPYPKSQAFDLHPDSIAVRRETAFDNDGRQIKVHFHPFTGVAPRLYQRVFLENRRLKDSAGSLTFDQVASNGPWDESRFDYATNEARLLGGAR